MRADRYGCRWHIRSAAPTTTTRSQYVRSESFRLSTIEPAASSTDVWLIGPRVLSSRNENVACCSSRWQSAGGGTIGWRRRRPVRRRCSEPVRCASGSGCRQLALAVASRAAPSADCGARLTARAGDALGGSAGTGAASCGRELSTRI